jgi:predicted nucleotidyltransferase
MEKSKIIHLVKQFILKHANPDRIYLYGSQANSESQERSDIDIAFDDKAFHEMYLIESELEKISTLLKIDVKNIAMAEERFKNRVKESGKVIYSASKKLRAEDALHNSIGKPPALPG